MIIDVDFLLVSVCFFCVWLFIVVFGIVEIVCINMLYVVGVCFVW